MTLAYIAGAVFAATLVGGVFALRFRDRLHLVLGFSAGAVAGVALFELLPEAFEIGMLYHTPATIASFIALGFFGYLILDRLVLLHAHDGLMDTPCPSQGMFGALTLATHSFLDGVAIGIAFQASLAIGVVVAVAVLAHDFSDGINTVNFVLKNGGSPTRAFRWLVLDAAAPVLGIVSTYFFVLSEPSLGLILALFAGTFLYLSASDLIPESHHRHPRALTTAMTVFGALVMYVIVRLV
ncbi:MAG: ZIP family metal transporter [Candidatus Paceibacterota bacterium]|jgi:ZIP family zinc transporter